MFLALLSGIISLIWRRATQHVRQRLLEAENTILDLKRDRRRLIDRTVKTQGHNIDLQFELSQQDELRERDRAHDRQVIRKAVGLLDRTLVELHALNQFQTFYAPSGRCWHFSRECGALANTAQVTVRNPCSFCLNGHLPPHVPNEHTGKTLAEDCAEFFAAHGPREDLHQHYHILRAGHVTFECFSFTPFLSVSIALHATHSFEASHVERGHRDIAFSLRLVIDLGRSHFHCPFSIQEWVGIL